MTVLGIDLAASPTTTGVARLDGRRLQELVVDVDDDRIVEFAAGTTKIAIDCPLGGRSTRPDALRQDAARVEGWIAIPTGTLADLGRTD